MMKVQADMASGVYAVDDFGESAEVMTAALFFRCLCDLPEGDVIGADLGLEMLEKIIREYGIAARPGGSPLTSAARALRAIPSAKRSETARANGKKGGRPRKAPANEITDTHAGQLAHDLVDYLKGGPGK